MVEVVGFEVVDQRGHRPVAHELVEALTLEQTGRTAAAELVGVVRADQAAIVADAVGVRARRERSSKRMFISWKAETRTMSASWN